MMSNPNTSSRIKREYSSKKRPAEIIDLTEPIQRTAPLPNRVISPAPWNFCRIKEEENIAVAEHDSLAKGFRDLPLSVRLKVWEFAAFQTRIIGITAVEFGEIKYDFRQENEGKSYQQAFQFQPFFYKTHSTVPVVLHTCQESRMEGLRHYTLDFGVNYSFSKPQFTFSTAPTTYINWKADRICIFDPEAFAGKKVLQREDLRRRCDKNNLRYIAYNISRSVDKNCDLILSSSMVTDIILFSGNLNEIRHAIFQKKITSMAFSVNLDFDPDNGDYYWNGGDYQWQKMERTVYMKMNYRDLVEDLKRRARRAEQDRNRDGLVRDYRVPEIKLCRLDFFLQKSSEIKDE